jgi:carbon monoxide dehydrogenase subunit G
MKTQEMKTTEKAKRSLVLIRVPSVSIRGFFFRQRPTEDDVMLRFEGDRDFPLPPAVLFARLCDARFLVQCIPDVEKVVDQAPERATLVLRPGFSFVRGTLDVTLSVTDVVAPSSVRVSQASKGIGSSAEVEATLSLSAHEGGTRVHWTAEITKLGGLLKMVPGGLIRGAAEKVINDSWARLTARVAEEGARADPLAPPSGG